MLVTEMNELYTNGKQVVTKVHTHTHTHIHTNPHIHNAHTHTVR